MISINRELDLGRLSKDQRSRKAREHHTMMLIKHEDRIQESIKGTVKFTPNSIPRNKKDNVWTTKQEVLATDTVSALFRVEGKKICLLNFASFKNPGGGFMSGALAQEEDLCHRSYLYEVLVAFKDSYYQEGLKYLHRGMYTDRMLYTPSVLFEGSNGVTKEADVITCAAPNFAGSKNVDREENTTWLSRRIDRVFTVAETMGVDTFIVGAWGCGVFGQDPEEVASLMAKRAKTFGGESVIYAVPPGRNGNYQVFQRVVNADC